MPLYEYLCRDCDREVELLVRSTEERLQCPECGGGKLSKLLSVPIAHGGQSGPEGRAGGGPGAGGCGAGCGCHPG